MGATKVFQNHNPLDNLFGFHVLRFLSLSSSLINQGHGSGAVSSRGTAINIVCMID
jgi:hypothetical protein